MWAEPEGRGEVERGEGDAEELEELDGLEDRAVELDDGREEGGHRARAWCWVVAVRCWREEEGSNST